MQRGSSLARRYFCPVTTNQRSNHHGIAPTRKARRAPGSPRRKDGCQALMTLTPVCEAVSPQLLMPRPQSRLQLSAPRQSQSQLVQCLQSCGEYKARVNTIPQSRGILERQMTPLPPLPRRGFNCFWRTSTRRPRVSAAASRVNREARKWEPGKTGRG